MRICSSSHDLSTENNYNFTHIFCEKNIIWLLIFQMYIVFQLLKPVAKIRYAISIIDCMPISMCDTDAEIWTLN